MMVGPVVKIDPDCLPQALQYSLAWDEGLRDLPNYFAGWDVGHDAFRHE